MKSFCFLLIITSCLAGCISSKNNPGGSTILTATALQAYGRSVLNDKQHLELISSAVHFGFSFEGKQCQIFVSLPHAGSHNYLQYELDGVYQNRIRIEADSSKPITIHAADGKHTVWFYKATEAHTGPVFIEKITGENLKALPAPEKPLIEFIGNSITCGAAADPSEVPCGKGQYHDQHNAYYAYGPRVSRALGAEFILSSVSGIGIYRNWNSDGPVMPDVYEKVDFQQQNPRLWNFDLYKPRVVSIALGTNDFSGGDGKKIRLPFDSTVFVMRYIEFVRTVRSKYPDALIALLSSPMVNGSRRLLLQNCLNAVKNKIDPLYPSAKPLLLYFFQPMQARGCSGHPSVEDHAILAEELMPFFRKLIQ